MHVKSKQLDEVLIDTHLGMWLLYLEDYLEKQGILYQSSLEIETCTINLIKLFNIDNFQPEIKKIKCIASTITPTTSNKRC